MNEHENAEASVDYELAILEAAHLKVAGEARMATRRHESRAVAHEAQARQIARIRGGLQPSSSRKASEREGYELELGFTSVLRHVDEVARRIAERGSADDDLPF